MKRGDLVRILDAYGIPEEIIGQLGIVIGEGPNSGGRTTYIQLQDEFIAWFHDNEIEALDASG